MHFPEFAGCAAFRQFAPVYTDDYCKKQSKLPYEDACIYPIEIDYFWFNHFRVCDSEIEICLCVCKCRIDELLELEKISKMYSGFIFRKVMLEFDWLSFCLTKYCFSTCGVDCKHWFSWTFRICSVLARLTVCSTHTPLHTLMSNKPRLTMIGRSRKCSIESCAVLCTYAIHKQRQTEVHNQASKHVHSYTRLHHSWLLFLS